MASASSSKHVKKAKIRASISLRAEEFDPRSNIRGRRFRSKTGSGSESVSSTSKGSSSNSKDLDVDFPAKTVNASPSRTKEQVTSANDPTRERQLSSSLRSSCPSKSFLPKGLEKRTTKMDSDVDASPKIAIGPPSVAQLSQVPNPSSLKHTEKIDPEIHEGGRSLRTRLGLLSLSSTSKASPSNYLELLLEKKTNEIHVDLPKITDTPTKIVEKNLGPSEKFDDSTPSFAIVMSRKALIKSTFAHAA